jgi:uncharacterized protein (TIGR03067 family)
MNKAIKRRLITLVLSLAALVIGCATHPTPASDLQLQRLQGTWEGASAGDNSTSKITITIAGDSLHFHRDTNFWFKTKFTLPAGKDPQQLHATIKDSSAPLDTIGKVVVAIFKIEDGKLILAATGDDANKTVLNFESEGLSRYELQKVKPHNKNTHVADPK